MDITAMLPSPDMVAFGPDILNLIEIELQSRKLTYKEIAGKVHTATGTVGSWFCRGVIPPDKIFAVVSAVGSAKLWMQVAAKIPGNVFAMEFLDSTDDHPFTTLDDAVEAAEEFLRIAHDSKTLIKHKKQGHLFEERDERAIQELEDRIADLIVQNKMVLIRLEDHFGRNVLVVMERLAKRMRDRGFVRDEKKRSSVLEHKRS